MYLPAQLIKKTRQQTALSNEEISFLVNEFSAGQLPDYQMAAWLMAVCFQGLSVDETHWLTQAMLNSGERLDFGSRLCADKHSTGGVGDKTSLIVAPIVAACGVSVPMISGRGLGHTGGTLDKLESIPGFRTNLSLVEFKSLVEKHGLCFIGQTETICPADRRMYALRDVTATVESVPLISASIMSKKLAEGIGSLVLDVKVGSGAFMKTLAEAETLAHSLVRLGRAAGKRVSALLSSMAQPLGRMAGNAPEVREAIGLLEGDANFSQSCADTRALSLELAAEMLSLSKPGWSRSEALGRAEEALVSGRAAEKFAEICAAQGGRLRELPEARHSFVVHAKAAGYLESFDTEAIGIACVQLGAGRKKASDKVDPTAGLEVHKKIGDSISLDEPLFTLFASDSGPFAEVQNLLLKASKIGLQKNRGESLILKRVLDEG